MAVEKSRSAEAQQAQQAQQTQQAQQAQAKQQQKQLKKSEEECPVHRKAHASHLRFLFLTSSCYLRSLADVIACVWWDVTTCMFDRNYLRKYQDFNDLRHTFVPGVVFDGRSGSFVWRLPLVGVASDVRCFRSPCGMGS